MSRLYNTIKNIVKGGAQKTTGTEVKDFVGVAKNLSKKRKFQDDIIKRRDEILRDYKITDQQQKIELRKSANQPKINKKLAKIQDRKAKGGRVGLRKGTPNPFGKKSNPQKIAEVFGPKRKIKKEKIRMQAKKGGDVKKKKKFPDLTGDGKVTFADVLKGRGVIKGKKKTKKKII
tara:strand:- start:43 stop:567 length:525 start_codon:yes stop_codon:yes gene_type:complete